MKVLVRAVAAAVLLAACSVAHAQDDDTRRDNGWYWYAQTPPYEADPPPPPAAWREENATALREAVQKAYERALDKALMFPSAENFAAFKRVQDFVVNKSTRFAQSSREAYLLHPELDYNLEYSNANAAAPIYFRERRRQEQEAIEELTRTNGLFFFYQGNNPVDVSMAYVVKAFAASHNLTVLMISVDGDIPSDLPESLRDSGQARHMNITHFPALFLVNPATREYRPVSYGFRAQDALAAQFRLVANDFEPDY